MDMKLLRGATALARDRALEECGGTMGESREHRWTDIRTMEEAAPADALSAVPCARFRARDCASFDKLLSAMRHEFGGHIEAKVAAE